MTYNVLSGTLSLYTTTCSTTATVICLTNANCSKIPLKSNHGDTTYGNI